jgi:hypothetical protein
MNRLPALLLITLTLSACASAAQQAPEEAFLEATDMTTECREKRLAGELRNYSESADCRDRARQNIAASGYPHMDLIDLMFAHDKALAQRVDSGEISEIDAQLLSAELLTAIAGEEQRRTIADYQTHLQKRQDLTHFLNSWNRQQQNKNQIQSPQRSITCTPSGNMVQCY